jgi:hypothetical protein
MLAAPGIFRLLHGVIMRLLLAAFLLLIPNVFRQSNPIAPSTKPSLNKGDGESKANGQKITSQNITICDCPPVEKPACQPEKANTYDPGHDTLYRAYLWFTIGGVLLALAGIGVVYRQGQVIKNAERAWITVSPTEWSPPLRSDGPHQLRGKNVFRARLTNAGKTPARVIGASLRYILIDSLEALPKLPEYGASEPEPELIVAPHEATDPQDILTTYAVLETESDGMLSWADHSAIIEGTMILYAFGFIRYLDVHGKERETRFGYHYAMSKPNEVMKPAFRQAGPAIYRRVT